ISRGRRAFEIRSGHKSFVRERSQPVPSDLAEVDTAAQAEPRGYSRLRAERLGAMDSDEAIELLESYMFKRLWRDSEENIRESEFRMRHDRGQLKAWLCDRLENLAEQRSEAFTLGRLAAGLIDDREAQAVAEVLAGSASFSLERIL